jgi:DNA-binding NarL/FixJ family response regulator
MCRFFSFLVVFFVNHLAIPAMANCSLPGFRNDTSILQEVAIRKNIVYIKTHTNYYKCKLDSGNQFSIASEKEASPFFSRNTEDKKKEFNIALFDNYHLNVICTGEHITPSNDSLDAASPVQRVLLINTRQTSDSLPWYETPLAYLLYVLLLGSLTGTTLRIYLKKQKRKKQYLIDLKRQTLQQLKNEMLEAELENKKNELVKQTSALTRKGVIMNTLLEELEHQKNMMGDRYPTKLYARMRSLMEKELSDHNDRIAFETYFNTAHQNFIERFRQQYTDITTGDLRICCLLRMNLSTKEIASILNISVRAVELRRYRLRKRIGLDSDTNLVDFLLSF